MDETTAATSAVDDLDEKIKILETGILEQENQIYLTSTTLIPSLKLKDQCKDLTEEDKTRIIDRC